MHKTSNVRLWHFCCRCFYWITFSWKASLFLLSTGSCQFFLRLFCLSDGLRSTKPFKINTYILKKQTNKHRFSVSRPSDRTSLSCSASSGRRLTDKLCDSDSWPRWKRAGRVWQVDGRWAALTAGGIKMMLCFTVRLSADQRGDLLINMSGAWRQV